MLLAAARRFALIFVGLAAGTVLLSFVFGVAVGARVPRAIAVGLYVVGSILLIGSFFLGNRGPFRPKWGDETRRGGFLAPRGVRVATPEDRSQAVRSSVLLFSIGLLLIVIGTFVDPAHRAV